MFVCSSISQGTVGRFSVGPICRPIEGNISHRLSRARLIHDMRKLSLAFRESNPYCNSYDARKGAERKTRFIVILQVLFRVIKFGGNNSFSRAFRVPIAAMALSIRSSTFDGSGSRPPELNFLVRLNSRTCLDFKFRMHRMRDIHTRPASKRQFWAKCREKSEIIVCRVAKGGMGESSGTQSREFLVAVADRSA